ncbi:MAG TPA: isochorismatase family cysteine hydrolase [Solirubrobacteraceae bacterium]|jgi:nicotinamidase-related amidase|nr:isochorismatase family cysteine hydrolase [Solirubrobacteraceae bacterium]
MGARERIEADAYLAPRWSTSALITIDTQRDVLDGGALEIAGTSEALPAMARLAESFRAAGRPIVHVVRIYERDGANVDVCRRGAVESGARMLAPGDSGTELAPGLAPAGAPPLDADALLAGELQPLGPGEVAVYKPRWGAFFGTRLEEHLRAKGVDTLVFCGCNFPNCPRTSIYEASERDFRIVVAADALSGLYDRGASEIAGIGSLMLGSDEVCAALGARA